MFLASLLIVFIAVRWSEVCEFHGKRIKPRTQHLFPSCLAQKLQINCSKNWPSRWEECSFETWRVEFRNPVRFTAVVGTCWRVEELAG